MFVVVIFHLFYVFVKICIVFVVELIVKVIPVKYGRELTLTHYMHPLQLPVLQRISFSFNSTAKFRQYVIVFLFVVLLYEGNFIIHHRNQKIRAPSLFCGGSM